MPQVNSAGQLAQGSVPPHLLTQPTAVPAAGGGSAHPQLAAEPGAPALGSLPRAESAGSVPAFLAEAPMTEATMNALHDEMRAEAQQDKLAAENKHALFEQQIVSDRSQMAANMCAAALRRRPRARAVRGHRRVSGCLRAPCGTPHPRNARVRALLRSLCCAGLSRRR